METFYDPYNPDGNPNVCDPSMSVDVKCGNYTLPILAKEQYVSSSERCSDYRRACELVDSLIQSLLRLEGLFEKGYDVASLDKLARAQLWFALTNNGFTRIPGLCGVPRGKEEINTHEAVFNATEPWEIAMAITPYLVARDFSDDEIANAINFARKRVRFVL